MTDNPLDLLIDGPGFFAVQDGAGNTFYTRQGSFTLSDDGVVVTQDGMTLQGDGGDIEVGTATRLVVNPGGQVYADGALVGTIPLYTFERPTPSDASGPAAEAEDVRIVGGALERSNVSVVEEMVRMIEAQRAYEGASKALMAHDEQTGKLITAYGRG